MKNFKRITMTFDQIKNSKIKLVKKASSDVETASNGIYTL